MSTPVVTVHEAVVGDGTSARSRSARRWRRARWPLGLLALVVVAGILSALPEPRTSTLTLAPGQPRRPAVPAPPRRSSGAQGVDVRYVRHIADVEALAVPGSTVLVVGDYLLTDDAGRRPATPPDADLVLVDAGWALGVLTASLASSGGYVAAPEVRDARSATTRTRSPPARSRRAAACWPPAPARSSASRPRAPTTDQGGAYAVVESDGRRIVALTDMAPFTNEHLAEQGNAALVLRALGRHERLVWYIPSLDDVGRRRRGRAPPPGELLPPVVPILALQLLLVVVVAALWRGRRLGRLVTERLPVVVRAGETTRGRGRLYRRARSYGHAAAALRAGTAARSAGRLGLPRSARRAARRRRDRPRGRPPPGGRRGPAVRTTTDRRPRAGPAGP